MTRSPRKADPAKMGRPITLAEPLATMAKDAEGIGALLPLLGAKSPSTIRRWSDLLKHGIPLPPRIAAKIEKAQQDIQGAQRGRRNRT
jgi:hypothetical protein